MLQSFSSRLPPPNMFYEFRGYPSVKTIFAFPSRFPLQCCFTLCPQHLSPLCYLIFWSFSSQHASSSYSQRKVFFLTGRRWPHKRGLLSTGLFYWVVIYNKEIASPRLKCNVRLNFSVGGKLIWLILPLFYWTSAVYGHMSPELFHFFLSLKEVRQLLLFCMKYFFAFLHRHIRLRKDGRPTVPISQEVGPNFPATSGTPVCPHHF